MAQTVALFNEGITAVAALATVNGASHDCNSEDYARFRAFVRSTTAGNARIQQSADGVTWYTTKTQALTASTPVVVEDIVALKFCRVTVENTDAVTAATTVVHTARVAI